jgi:Serine dehydrogenase proteinase
MQIGPTLTRENRVESFKKLEKIRNSRIISYVTGDRPSFGPNVPSLATQIGSDVVRYFRDIIEGLGDCDNLDLFIYSRGGETTAVLPIVHLLRKHCKKFGLLIPFRAHSAATLISLGADEILMGEMGQLSPIDPTTGSVFNPIDPINPAGRWPISVEDITAYLSLAKDKAMLTTEESLRDVFHLIAEKVHPIALGNVHRIYNFIRILAPKLLSTHMTSSTITEQTQIKTVVDTLTEKLYTHDYVISCQEAKDIGLKVTEPTEEVETLMWELYKVCETDLKLLEPFNPSSLLGQQAQQVNFSEECAYLESSYKGFKFVTSGQIYPPPSLQDLVNMLPPPTIQQVMPQLIQLLQQVHLLPATVKFTSQTGTSLIKYIIMLTIHMTFRALEACHGRDWYTD